MPAVTNIIYYYNTWQGSANCDHKPHSKFCFNLFSILIFSKNYKKLVSYLRITFRLIFFGRKIFFNIIFKSYKKHSFLTCRPLYYDIKLTLCFSSFCRSSPLVNWCERARQKVQPSKCPWRAHQTSPKPDLMPAIMT